MAAREGRPPAPADRPCHECGEYRMVLEFQGTARAQGELLARVAGHPAGDASMMSVQPFSWALLCPYCGSVSLFIRDPRG